MARSTHLFLMTFLLAVPSFAHASLESLDYALGQLAAKYTELGGPAKALAQVRCFVRNQAFKKFHPKPAGDMSERCNARAEIALESERGVTIVDYTAPSTQPRFFLFDLYNNTVRALYVGHGRYGDTPRTNTKLSMSPRRNSILRALHFSNEPGLNASAGGFYLTGPEYEGVYGRSVVLHGLEGDVNDNACLRATVIHSSSKITENSTDLMSSGCPMVARTKIDYVVDTVRNGTLFYSYTPAEAALAETDCGRNLN